MINIYFVRHGETDLNRAHIVQGHIDTHGLNDAGRAQAQVLVEAIKKLDLKGDALLSSPQKRAFETAQPLAALFGLPVATDPRLKEMYFGSCDGIPTKDLRAMIFNPPLSFLDHEGAAFSVANGMELRDWHASNDPRYDNLAHPGGESKAQVRARACDAVFEFLDKNKNARNVWIVCHGALLRFVTAHFAPKGALDGAVKNASILHFIHDKPRSLTWQGQLHAPEDALGF